MKRSSIGTCSFHLYRNSTLLGTCSAQHNYFKKCVPFRHNSPGNLGLKPGPIPPLKKDLYRRECKGRHCFLWDRIASIPCRACYFAPGRFEVQYRLTCTGTIWSIGWLAPGRVEENCTNQPILQLQLRLAHYGVLYTFSVCLLSLYKYSLST